jgi:hypothetical protein
VTSPTAAPGSPSPAPRTPWKGFALLLLLTLAVRLAVLSGRTDELQLDRYGGTLAQAYLVGLPLDPAGLPVIPHLRGSYLFGLLLVPLTALFGPTLVTLKIVALGWTALTLWVLMRVADLALGHRAAVWAGLLYAFGPPALQMVDLLALGSHADTLLPILWPLAWLLARGWRRPFKTWEAWFFGVTIGFGLLFSMQCWVALPALVAVWWRVDPRPWQGLRVAWVAAGALPLAALVPVLTKSATLVNRPIEGRFLPKGFGGAVEKLWAVLSEELRASWLFDNQWPAAVGWVLFLSLLAGALLALRALFEREPAAGAEGSGAPDGRALLTLFGWLHCAALFGAYAISDFQVNLEASYDGMGSRYLFPIWPSLVFLALVGFGFGRGSAPPSTAWRAPIYAALVACVLGVIGLVRPASDGELTTQLSHEPYASPWHFQYAEPEDLNARWRWVERMDPDWADVRAQTYARCFFDERHGAGLKQAAGQHGGGRADVLARALLIATKQVVRDLDPGPAEAHAVGCGGEVIAKLVLESQGELDLLHAKLEPFALQATRVLGPELGAGFLRGMGHNLHAAFAVTARRHDEGKVGEQAVERFLGAIAALPDAGREEVLAGIGFKLGLRFSRFARLSLLTLEGYQRLPADQREVIAYWAARGYRVRFLERAYAPPSVPYLEEVWGRDPRVLAAWRAGLEAPRRSE